MKCYRHPNVETNLSCGKCGKPICVKCTVQTPVGGRCPECARLYRLPTYRVTPAYYARGIAAGAGLAAVGGVLWAIVQSFIPYFYLNVLIGPAMGYGIGEVMSLAVNRKRGRGLALIAGIAVVASYGVSLVVRGGFPYTLYLAISDIIAVGLAVFVAVRSFVVGR